ncbi:hypothetical protein ACTMU2_32470 [Cupriavidus basilensis]
MPARPDFSPAALRAAAEAAYNIARFTAEDDCAGLAEEELLEHNPQDLDLFHPWMIDAEGAIDIARRAEAAAFAVSPRIKNSDGASVSAQHSQFVLATTRGFSGGYPYSRHFISCAPIAGTGSGMQRDDWVLVQALRRWRWLCRKTSAAMPPNARWHA